jgi:4-amino-4-deoxy-L-arabinose transferase-like glycosyltransferase
VGQCEAHLERGQPDLWTASTVVHNDVHSGSDLWLKDGMKIAIRPLAALSVAYAALLIAFSGRYGYHRDELYFIAIGGHPAFGYVDQPPLVPLLAHAMSALPGGSLVVLRLPSAIAGALIVFATGLIAREFGAVRGAQLLAAGAMAAAAVLAATAHLMSTTTYDLLGWTICTWLVVRALRERGRAWLWVGLAAGVDLEVKSLMVFLLFALLVGVLAVGPRDVLRDRWLWLAGAVALVLWLPNLWWQATHGWPQLELSKAVASGASGTSQPRWAFVPYQFLLVSPVLFPIWVAGLVRLAREPMWRCIAVAYGVLVVVLMATGGKPYYLAGMFPVLLAAGAEPTLAWVHRHRSRRIGLGIALGLSLAVSCVLFLPVVPADDLDGTPIVGINYDAGETVGWPQFVHTIKARYDALPNAERSHAVVLTENYGEAGAVLHYSALPTYSGQNSMWDLGPPPADTTTVLAVGIAPDQLRQWFGQVRQVATIDNGVGLDNDEQGTPVWLCQGRTIGWPQLWPKLRHLS